MNNEQGEYRCLKPEEIGRTVVMFRKALDWKQLTLALEAGLTERTIQRIERGEKVDENTLRKIAKALRLQENAFVGPRYVPSESELLAEFENTLKEITVIEARTFASLKDCDAVLHTHGFIVDDRAAGDELAEDVAAFKDLTRDWMDLYGDISVSEQVEACRSVLESAQRIEAKGYQIRFGTYGTDDDFQVAALLITSRAEERFKDIKQLVVPRCFTTMAKASLQG